MSEKLREALSAAMDGEADEFELRRVLDETADDESLRAVWHRYHLVRSIMRGESRGLGRESMVESIWRRIDAGEVVDEDSAREPPRSAPSWVGRVAGATVAASVALGVVLMFSIESGTPLSAQIGLASTDELTAQGSRAAGAAQPELAEFPTRSDLRRTQAYMLYHAQHTSMNKQAGPVPFVRFAAFQGSR